ncbi:hypothetical protein LJC10_06370 [Selenomonadales bacterium OttesenSCG-928-I06]|nr:hypothetical protein [Selenomonadales bacterium OttesenSCG-928-I06]
MQNEPLREFRKGEYIIPPSKKIIRSIQLQGGFQIDRIRRTSCTSNVGYLEPTQQMSASNDFLRKYSGDFTKR